MRSSTLHTLVSALVLLDTAQAIPNLQYVFQRPQQLAQSVQTRPSWRILSDKVIKTIWGIKEEVQDKAGCHDLLGKLPPFATKSKDGSDLVLRFNITTVEEAKKLAEIANYMYLDVWDHTSEWVDLRLAKDVLPHVLRELPESMRHSHTALMQEKELQQAIYDSYPSSRKTNPFSYSDSSLEGLFTSTTKPLSAPRPAAETNIFFTDYQPLSVITPWMRLLSSLFTTHVRLITIGTSHEGREISALRVGVHPTNDEAPPKKRKTVLITGGIHAREWISTSTVTFIAYTLITEYGKNSEVTQLLEDFDWIFVPTLNPDGYVYSWEHDRLWRKNRQATPLHFCFGVDLDRAFPFQWDSSTAGNPCSESYAGESPLEGVEARAVADWVKHETETNNVEFVGLLDLHSYSQQILYPYSYSCEAYPPSLENLEELAVGLSKAIRIQSGHSYMSKQACEGNVAFGAGAKDPVGVRFESAGGSALDWFYHEVGIRYAYQVKLRDRGAYGFLLPKEHIVPTGKEMLEAVLYFGRYVDGEFEGLSKQEKKQERRRRTRSQSGW